MYFIRGYHRQCFLIYLSEEHIAATEIHKNVNLLKPTVTEYLNS